MMNEMAPLTLSAGTPYNIDEIDRKILRFIQKDGRASLRTISREIGSNVSTVKHHIDRLRNEEVILDYIAIVDCCKIGIHEMLLIFLRVNNKVGIQEIFKDLGDIPEINAIYQVSGNFPIFCLAKCIEKTDQIDLLEIIKKIPGVEEMSTQVVLQRFKEDMRVPIK